MQMQEPSALGRIVELVRDLRKRCPWDAAQTPETLRPYLVEEALELDHAIADGDFVRLREELGDLLLHVAFQIVLAEERGQFGPEDVTLAVEQKMWSRHPHLFPPAESPSDGGGTEGAAPAHPLNHAVPHSDLNVRWERAKRAERDPRISALDGLPPTLPALVMAYRLQEKAAGVGFDWPDADGPRKKVYEEMKELERAVAGGGDAHHVRHELGDLLFAVVNLSRKLGHDPRAALEQANRRFRERFGELERLAEERGIDVGRASLADLDRLWEDVKQDEPRAT